MMQGNKIFNFSFKLIWLLLTGFSLYMLAWGLLAILIILGASYSESIPHIMAILISGYLLLVYAKEILIGYSWRSKQRKFIESVGFVLLMGYVFSFESKVMLEFLFCFDIYSSIVPFMILVSFIGLVANRLIIDVDLHGQKSEE